MSLMGMRLKYKIYKNVVNNVFVTPTNNKAAYSRIILLINKNHLCFQVFYGGL